MILKSIILRPILKEDLEEIYKINNEVQAFPWTFKALSEEFQNPFFKGLTATLKDNPQVIGYIFTRINGPELEVMSIGVAVKYQRNSIARQLLNEALKGLGQGGKAFLEVSETNEGAISLYKKVGFSVFSQRKNYYPDGTAALCLKLNIAKS